MIIFNFLKIINVKVPFKFWLTLYKMIKITVIS